MASEVTFTHAQIRQAVMEELTNLPDAVDVVIAAKLFEEYILRRKEK